MNESDLQLSRELEFWYRYKDPNDLGWPGFAYDILGINYFDPWQEEALHKIQISERTSIRSGHGCGKDFISCGVAAHCFLWLNVPSHVIMTGPTARQVKLIMMKEFKRTFHDSKIKLGGKLLVDGWFHPDVPDWYLLGFKAGDKSPTDWTGFHSENIMVIVTEASGIEQETFEAIEGLLTGNSKFLIVFNPTQTQGETYSSTVDPQYTSIRFSCLDAVNVKKKEEIIPGQVDWNWVNNHVLKAGWTTRIDEKEVDETQGDFFWEGHWYRPSDLGLVKILGLFPREPEGQLIPLAWIERSNQLWIERNEQLKRPVDQNRRLGIDVAGMGNDSTVFIEREDNFVFQPEVFSKSDHMETAGIAKNRVGKRKMQVDVDTIGEGAGVYSRLKELQQLGEFDPEVKVNSVKFSEAAKDQYGKFFTDMTGEREFKNMRAYCYWAVRDGLDPQLGIDLALPPDEELKQELMAQQYETKSDGKIILKPKEDIKKDLGRSPDKADALALTYYRPNMATPSISGLSVDIMP